MTTKELSCQHEASKLQFSKMFINDNGSFGGQHVSILLDCDCGDTVFIHSYRGNVSDQYVRPNSILHRDSTKELTELKQQEIW